MNIAKKLLFSLLLCGTVFAAACGDDGKTGKENDKCGAEVSCDTGLVCVVAATDATEGTCTKTCLTDATCSGSTPKCKDATVFKDSTAGKTCQADTIVVQKQQKDQPCSKSQVCDEGLDCVVANDNDAAGTCKEKCGPANCNNGKSCQPGTKKLKDTTEAPEECKTGAAPGKEGGKCNASTACDGGLSCIVANDGDAEGTCEKECDTTNCASPKVCEEGSKKVAGATTAPKVCKVAVKGDCSDASAICVNGSTCYDDVCAKSCTDPGTDGSNDCTGVPGMPNCKNVTIDGAPVALCQA